MSTNDRDPFRDGSPLLWNLIAEFEQIDPPSGYAGRHLTNEVQIQLRAAVGLMERFASATRKGEDGVLRLFERHVNAEEKRQRRLIKNEVGAVLREVCHGIEEKARSDMLGSVRFVTRKHLLLSRAKVGE